METSGHPTTANNITINKMKDFIMSNKHSTAAGPKSYYSSAPRIPTLVGKIHPDILSRGLSGSSAKLTAKAKSILQRLESRRPIKREEINRISKLSQGSIGNDIPNQRMRVFA